METRESVERCVRRATRLIGSCVLFVVVATAAPAQTRTTPRATLNGTIIEQYSSLPVPDATVQLYDSTNRPLSKSITDGSGRFRLEYASSGTVRIRVVRLGYLPVESMITVEGAATSDDIKLAMQRNTMLDSILVVAESSEPPLRSFQQLIIGRLLEEESGDVMPEGTIELRDAKNKVVGTARTDRRGRFRLQTPAPGTYSLTGKRIGYLAAQQSNLRMQPGDTVLLDFRLSKTAVLLGPVTVTASAKVWTDRVRSPQRDALYSRMDRFKNRHQAQFILRDTIDALNRRNFTTAEAINRIVLMNEPKNGGCSGVKHYIDGNHYIIPFEQRLAEQLVMLSGIELIEVFTHPTIPAEFASPNLVVSARSSTVPPCRVISVWSRPGE